MRPCAACCGIVRFEDRASCAPESRVPIVQPGAADAGAHVRSEQLQHGRRLDDRLVPNRAPAAASAASGRRRRARRASPAAVRARADRRQLARGRGCRRRPRRKSRRRSGLALTRRVARTVSTARSPASTEAASPPRTPVCNRPRPDHRLPVAPDAVRRPGHVVHEPSIGLLEAQPRSGERRRERAWRLSARDLGSNVGRSGDREGDCETRESGRHCAGQEHRPILRRPRERPTRARARLRS